MYDVYATYNTIDFVSQKPVVAYRWIAKFGDLTEATEYAEWCAKNINAECQVRKGKKILAVYGV